MRLVETTTRRSYLVVTNDDIQVFQCSHGIFRIRIVLGVDMGGIAVIVCVPRLVNRCDRGVVDARVIHRELLSV